MPIKCVKHSKNHRYCIRERAEKKFMKAMELLYIVNTKVMKLLKALSTKYADEPNVKRLLNGYNSLVLHEILPTDDHVAYVENKGDKVALCLQLEKYESKFIDINTLTFVILHEISHIASVSIGHTSEFRENFRFVLDEAVKSNIYEPIDYSKSPVRYCGMTIKHNPYYDIEKNSHLH